MLKKNNILLLHKVIGLLMIMCAKNTQIPFFSQMMMVAAVLVACMFIVIKMLLVVVIVCPLLYFLARTKIIGY